jgi:quinol monooxygenase YgiN
VIIVAGCVDLDPGQRDAALAAAIPLLDPTREQTGCLAYVWSPDPVEPGRLQVYELWEGEAALAAHFSGAWYRKMLETLSRHGIRHVEVAKYEVGHSEPVYDPKGRPRADFFTRDDA